MLLEANISKTAGDKGFVSKVTNRQVMAYVESNGHVLDDVTCPVFLFVTQCIFYATFRIDKITSKYRKSANIIEKNFSLSHC